MSEIVGKLVLKNNEQTFGSNGFRKREFVIETDSQYPQEIMIELVQDKCSLIDSFELGNVLKVSYNLNGRQWTNPQGETKYFNSIQGWRIESVGSEQQAPPQTQDDKDNLPF